jgi:His-Xaa-Ser system radical SAM maturase HxsB
MALPLTRNPADPDLPSLFRYRRVDGHYLLTNPVGQYLFVTEEEFDAFLSGAVATGSSLERRLAEKHLLRSTVDAEALASEADRRKRFLDYGPNLHIVELTLRCNQTCAYCHSSRADLGAADKDMSLETADQVVELIFRSTSPSLTIEFQGGEPLANFEVLQRVVERALEKNQQAHKALSFSLVTNLSMMDEQKLAYLLERRVQICTSIDGPKAVHNRQRRLPSGDSFNAAEQWIRRVNQAYQAEQLATDVYHVEGLLTVTRETLAYPKEIVDTYVDLGFRALFLRPLDPFGFASKASKLAFSAEEFLAFYRQALDYMLELNLEGKQVLERYAAILLTKILTGEDPNFLDLRSPCGAGVGQVAYTYDGGIFTCDEARMLHHMGDDFFALGQVGQSSYRDVVGHDTVKALLLASNLDSSPDCSECVYNPYCGICPVYNYTTQGSLHGQMRTSPWCTILMGIQDTLFVKLRQAEPRILEIFESWVSVRSRDHYLHLGAR